MKRSTRFLTDDPMAGLLTWLVGAAVIVLVCGNCAWSGDSPSGNIVDQAYQLRLDGKVDSAKILLDGHIAANPADAAAYYELARIYYYMGPGDMKNLESTTESAGKSIQKAVELDPGNPIYRYFAARVVFLKSYIAMESDQERAKELVAAIQLAYETVLESKPDYGEPMLNLIELYGGLPAELGRDSSKAAQYEARLKKIDPVLAGEGYCIMMPDDFDRIAYWEDMTQQSPGDLRLLEELGKTCLRERKTDQGVAYLEEVIKAEPSNSVLYLVIANSHIMNARMDEKARETSIPLAMQAVSDFLAAEPIAPLKAYALGLMAKLNYAQGKEAEGDKWLEEAKAADAYFSKASGIPIADLFVPPDEISHNHSYLFQMF
jgi:tetratricopeptide (TPR) repeat protein